MRSDLDVHLCEVGMRDGLQNVADFMPTAEKLAWLEAEAAAGMPEMEVCSFVPPKLIPQFADASEVCERALKIPGLTVAALIPNLKGAERGIAAGVHKLSFVISVSESHNQRNVRRSRDESVADFRRIVELVKTLDPKKRPKLAVGLSTALGCTIEGNVAESEVVRYAEIMADAGADEIAVPDTVGYANPGQVRRVFKAVMAAVGKIPVAAHFHDTRGLGIANSLAALDVGVRNFDACLAGLGGCPYAPGASGNIVMEDLVFLLEGMGLKTGVDLDRLIKCREILARALPNVELHGGVGKAGLPKGFHAATPQRQAAE